MNGPFISKQQFVPGDQIQRFGPTQELQMIHYDTPLFGTGQVLGADTNVFQIQGNVGNPDLCSLVKIGTFTDWKQFVIYGISAQLYFAQEEAAGAGEITAEECYELCTYYSRVHIHFANAEKQVLHLDQIPAGGGLTGDTNVAGSFHLTNGVPVAGGFYRLNEGLVITPGKSFKLIWRWNSSVVGAQADPRTAFNAAVNTRKMVRFSLIGIEARNVTDG